MSSPQPRIEVIRLSKAPENHANEQTMLVSRHDKESAESSGSETVGYLPSIISGAQDFTEDVPTDLIAERKK